VWLDPRDIEVAASGHFRVGCALVMLYGLAALVSRRIDRDPRARAVHPWIGAAALVLSGVQGVLGLQLVPLWPRASAAPRPPARGATACPRRRGAVDRSGDRPQSAPV